MLVEGYVDEIYELIEARQTGLIKLNSSDLVKVKNIEVKAMKAVSELIMKRSRLASVSTE